VIVIGGLFLLLALIGTFLSPEPVGQGQLPVSA
jgi:hypothetical protein